MNNNLTIDGAAIKSYTSKWFEVKVKYHRYADDGLLKTVKETYTLDALSFTEAEKRAIEFLSYYAMGELEVTEEKIAPYKEVLFSDKENDDRWYKCKVTFITISEKTEKKKRNSVYYLVQGNSTATAEAYIKGMLADCAIDYEVNSITETAIMDVYRYNDESRVHYEVQDVPVDELEEHIGQELADRVLTNYKEKFKDADTEEDVEVERVNILFGRFKRIDEDVIRELRCKGIQTVKLYVEKQ